MKYAINTFFVQSTASDTPSRGEKGEAGEGLSSMRSDRFFVARYIIFSSSIVCTASVASTTETDEAMMMCACGALINSESSWVFPRSLAFTHGTLLEL